MEVIEALRTSIMELHDHLHISRNVTDMTAEADVIRQAPCPRHP